MLTKCQHKNSAPIEKMKSLPVTQAGIARHKCAVCAYEQGLIEGFKLATKLLSLSDEEIISIYTAKEKANSIAMLDTKSVAKQISNNIKEKLDKK